MNVRQRRNVLAQMCSPVCGRTVALMLMVVSTVVRFFGASPRRNSALQREESSVLLWQLWMGGMRERMLNPVLSLVLANDLVSCVWSSPCTSRPLLSVLRLLDQQTLHLTKSRLEETTSRRLSMALERLEIWVDVLSMALISFAVSMRIGGLMELVLSSNAAKMIRNFACRVSNCKIVGSRWWFLFTGVVSFGVESVVRTDWLLAMVETMTEEAMGALTFDSRMWVCM